MRAKYPIPEYKPRGNGETAQMWQALRASDSMQPHKSLLKKRPNSWTTQPNPELDALLAVTEPQLQAYADVCAGEGSTLVEPPALS